MTGTPLGQKPTTSGKPMSKRVGGRMQRLYRGMLLGTCLPSIRSILTVLMLVCLSFLLGSLATLSLGTLLGVEPRPLYSLLRYLKGGM